MGKVKTIKLDKDKIVKQLAKISHNFESGKWLFEYNKDLDQLYFGKKIIPKSSFLYNLNDEINIFVTPKSTVNGIFIEYFETNYIKHNKNLKHVIKVLANVKMRNDKEKNKLAQEALEEKITNQALISIYNKKQLIAAVS